MFIVPLAPGRGSTCQARKVEIARQEFAPHDMLYQLCFLS
jgi:hypothetical protein